MKVEKYQARKARACLQEKQRKGEKGPVKTGGKQIRRIYHWKAFFGPQRATTT